MVRNLHITIHEAPPPRRRRIAAGRLGTAGYDPAEPLETVPDPSDPTEPLETVPDPSDPREPLETVPDPSDPTEPLETVPDPSDPTGRFLYGPPGAAAHGYGPVATVYETRGAAAPVACCCKPAEPATPLRPGTTVADRSGFVIVRLAAGIDPRDALSLWQLANGDPGLPALRAALELSLDDAGGAGGAGAAPGGSGEQAAAGAARTAGARTAAVRTAAVQTAGFSRKRDRKRGDRDRGDRDRDDRNQGGGDEPQWEPREPPPREPEGVLVSRPLIDVVPEPVPGPEGAFEEPVPFARTEQLARIRALEKAASRTSFPPLHSLTGYWRVDVRRWPDRIDEVIERFRRTDGVELAYAELAAEDPGKEGDLDGQSFDQDQGYLEDAPAGIGARWAWRALDAHGGAARVRVCDLEQRWHREHRDFDPDLFYDHVVGGHNRADGVLDFGHHGTAVVGQIAATARAVGGTALGVQGSAARIGEFVLASHWWSGAKLDEYGRPHEFRNTGGHVASAIVNLLVPADPEADRRLRPGDVLLVEVQRGRWPEEIEPPSLDAVRLASALGVIVVEAGGNGGFDLDRYADPDTAVGLNRSDPRFRDSGAIVVGAARSALPHDRASFSNHGSRVDCFGWGDSVTSTGYGDLYEAGGPNGADLDSFYTNSFSGTSSAAPIVAGAAALVQALHEAAGGSRLQPRAMRSALSDPRSGTRQGPNVSGHIGVMPNLCALVRDRLGLVEDVYMRSSVCDGGTRPVAGEIGSSPDIVPWTGNGNALDLFGEGVRANTPAPGNPFPWQKPAAQPADVYVRLRNRGRASKGVRVDLHAAWAATLITPERWRAVGGLNVKDVPQGDTLQVAGPVTLGPNVLGPPPESELWTGQVRPPVSILAVHGDAVLPPAPPYFDWAEYRSFLRGPGVAWRNVYKVAVGDSTGIDLAFLLAGTPGHGREFDFQVLQRLPAGVRATLRLPAALAAKIRQRQHWLGGNGGGLLELPTRTRTSLGRVHLPAGLCAPALFRLEWTSAAQAPHVGHSLAVRQLWRGEEVGRITWWFVRRPGQAVTTGGGTGSPIDPATEDA